MMREVRRCGKCRFRMKRLYVRVSVQRSPKPLPKGIPEEQRREMEALRQWIWSIRPPEKRQVWRQVGWLCVRCGAVELDLSRNLP